LVKGGGKYEGRVSVRKKNMPREGPFKNNGGEAGNFKNLVAMSILQLLERIKGGRMGETTAGGSKKKRGPRKISWRH